MSEFKKKILAQAEKIQGWILPKELATLYDITRTVLKKGDLAVEVGSWKGKSTLVIASVCKEMGASLTCIDTFIGSELDEPHYKEALDMGAQKFMSAYIKKNLAGLPVKYIIDNSLDAHKLIKNNSLTFCFIDGNHVAPVIGQDLDNYWPKVKSGGIFVMHDYNSVCPDVTQAVNRKFPDLKIREVKDSIVIIKK